MRPLNEKHSRSTADFSPPTHNNTPRRRCLICMEFTSPGPTTRTADWRAWHETHAARLVLYARQWLPERADAEDAVQAGFVKFWKNKAEPTERDVPLLYAAVRCAALD